MAQTSPAPKKSRFAWIGQMRDNYRMTKEAYPSLGWMMLAIFFGIFGVFFAIGYAIGNPVTLSLLGSSFGLLAAMFFFSRRAMSAAYKQVEDQPGVLPPSPRRCAATGRSPLRCR